MNENFLSYSLPKVRILVVDDHPGMASTLGRAIAQIGPGIEVLSAMGGQDAIEKVQDLPVDVLITDMMMPGMNGMDLIEKLRTHPAGQPSFMVLMTAYDVPGLKEIARRLRVNEIVIKPFPPERMRAIVEQALEGMKQPKSILQQSHPHNKFKILVADDVDANVLLLSRYLESEGFTYVTASNGSEALERTRAEMPDLILLDVNMPKKDGFQVLQELRSDPLLTHIPVIILTAARPDPVDIQTGLNLGADDYVTKPFDRRELLARIHTKLRAKESEETIRRRSQIFNVLPEIGRDFSARHDLDELAGIIVRRSVETLGAGAGHIYLFTPGQEALHKEFKLDASNGQSMGKTLPPSEQMLNHADDLMEGIIIADAKADPFWISTADETCHSLLVVPILGRTEPVGLMVLIHEKVGYFTADHRLLQRAIASQAAIAVEGNPLFNKPAAAAVSRQSERESWPGFEEL